jgi:hypothetical protein
MQYKGSCHCGQIAFEAEGELKDVLSCNCSICQRKGSLLWFIPRPGFKLHHFCPECGIHPFAEAADRQGNPMAAINVRCLEGVEPTSFPVKPFNGRAL